VTVAVTLGVFFMV